MSLFPFKDPILLHQKYVLEDLSIPLPNKDSAPLRRRKRKSRRMASWLFQKLFSRSMLAQMNACTTFFRELQFWGAQYPVHFLFHGNSQWFKNTIEAHVTRLKDESKLDPNTPLLAISNETKPIVIHVGEGEVPGALTHFFAHALFVGQERSL